MTSCSLFLLRQFDQAESHARKALDRQPKYLFGLWMLGATLFSLGRHREAVETIEEVVGVSRVPVPVGCLGVAYQLAGRAEDANFLLHELEERRSRGEYVSALSLLGIYAGVGNIPAVRRALAEAITSSSPVFTVSMACYPFAGTLRNGLRNQSHAGRTARILKTGCGSRFLGCSCNPERTGLDVLSD